MIVNKHINFLKRRGFLVKESYEITDTQNDEPTPEELRRIDNPTQVGIPKGLDLQNLCEAGDPTFCKLWDLQKSVSDNQELVDKLVTSVTKIYETLRPSIRDNRRSFTNLINTILDHDFENTINILSLVSEKIGDFSSQKIRTILKGVGGLPYDVVEQIIRDIKYNSYTEYENSFIGSHFSQMKTGLSLSLQSENQLNQTFTNLLVGAIGNKLKPELVSRYLHTRVLRNFRGGIGKYIKADLECEKTLKDDKGKSIITKGQFVEVKKMGYYDDSYLSEFFSIYKNPVPDILNTDEGLTYYNQVIDGLFELLVSNDGGLIDLIRENLAGIIFDNNRFVRIDDIYLYWSNKGQRKRDHRLSIRFRVNTGSELKTYIYNKDTDTMVTNHIKPKH
jgi:hypothetical protein